MVAAAAFWLLLQLLCLYHLLGTSGHVWARLAALTSAKQPQAAQMPSFKCSHDRQTASLRLYSASSVLTDLSREAIYSTTVL